MSNYDAVLRFDATNKDKIDRRTINGGNLACSGGILSYDSQPNKTAISEDNIYNFITLTIGSGDRDYYTN
jgi:hypothetical protein